MVGDRSWDRLSEDEKADRRADGPALAAELGAIRVAHPPFDVGALRIPVVYGRGEDSLPHHRRAVAWLVEHTPQGELFEIPGARHGAHLTHPDAFAAMVRPRPRPDGRAVAFPPMNVLVAGSTGLIGTALVNRLENGEHTRDPPRPRRSETVDDPGRHVGPARKAPTTARPSPSSDRSTRPSTWPVPESVIAVGRPLADRSSATAGSTRHGRLPSCSLSAVLVPGHS